MALKAVLEVKDFRVLVHLGVGEVERSEPQEVSVSLRFAFTEVPHAFTSDSIEDTVDYSVLCEMIKKSLIKKPFHTIEHMAGEALLAVQNKLLKGKTHGELTLSLHKLIPPVEGLHGGSRFQISGQI